LGLGLSISYNMVKDFDGALRAENHPEGGAVFTIELPLLPAAAGKAAKKVKEPA
jgi:two-component system C4-dicarboxylate transport sensor histidine kinase DctB